MYIFRNANKTVKIYSTPGTFMNTQKNYTDEMDLSHASPHRAMQRFLDAMPHIKFVSHLLTYLLTYLLIPSSSHSLWDTGLRSLTTLCAPLQVTPIVCKFVCTADLP